MNNVRYDQSDDTDIPNLLVGHKIVRAEMGSFPIPGETADSWVGPAEGLLVLDDGTELYLTGHDGGCACSAGCYPLASVATVDNIITSAHLNTDPSTDDDYERSAGVYQIFVFADAQAINVAEFRGTDGNGYYGTGFALTVRKPEVSQ
jgi:hypothetical protein